MRAVVYARFSSDLQRDASIDDQLEVCRRLLDREGWQLTKVYADRAISGASRNRPEYQQLLADADRGASTSWFVKRSTGSVESSPTSPISMTGSPSAVSSFSPSIP